MTNIFLISLYDLPNTSFNFEKERKHQQLYFADSSEVNTDVQPVILQEIFFQIWNSKFY